ncbi:MAG: hypothetical protein LBI45_04275 [Bacteroidales bacterium]|jgi:hypothetical protein|nr:hypothetical protein [Bacteroidales bacterium]
MKNPAVRNLASIILLLLYINRGFFITGTNETKNPDGEINSVLEYIVELITGESNDIDEDGDSQTDCNSVKIVHHELSQQLAKSIDLLNFSLEKNIKYVIPDKENIPSLSFFDKIDKPPEV